MSRIPYGFDPPLVHPARTSSALLRRHRTRKSSRVEVRGTRSSGTGRSNHRTEMSGCSRLSCFVPVSDSARSHYSTIESGFGPLTTDSRMSTIGSYRGSNVFHDKKQAQQRANLLRERWTCLILRTLLYGPAHGHQIGKHIQRTTNDFLQMQHGSLYPALHRLEERGWVISKWETAPDRNREFKYYRLTDKGKKQLVVEESQWKQMAEAVARVMWPAAEES